jgi:hypothetical protein
MQRVLKDAGKCNIFTDEAPTQVKQFQNGAVVVVGSNAPALSITVSGNTCTLGGTIQVGDTIGVMLGELGAGYSVQADDSLNSIAIALAAAATTAGITTTATGASVTVTEPPGIPAFNVGCVSSEIFESWRRRRMFYADLLVASPFERSALGPTIANLYSAQDALSCQLTMLDGSQATILAGDYIEFDDEQPTGLWMRRFRWLIDFVEIEEFEASEIVAIGLDAQIAAPGTTVTPFTFPLATQT